MRHTHSARLERWLGPQAVEGVSRAMRDFYWPIALHGVPGVVRAMPGGDFTGEIKAGSEASAHDRAMGCLNRLRDEQRARVAAHRMASSPFRSRVDQRQHAFASLSALITAGTTGGKRQNINFAKTGVASNAIGNGIDLWGAAGHPVAGAAGGAAPGGTAPTRSTAGALPFINPSSADTTHFVTGYATGSVAANTLLLYDRLFMVAKTMNSTAIEGVTGVPSRYQSTNSAALNYIGGNFCFPSIPTTVLANTAHNWLAGDVGSPTQGCTYWDHAGALSPFQLIAGVAACVVRGIDLVAGSWFMPLASGDFGVGRLGTMQASAAVATGTIDFVLGHPIAFMPCPVANMVCIVDGINTAFNLETIFDDACLSLLEMPKPATTATTYCGMVTAVSE